MIRFNRMQRAIASYVILGGLVSCKAFSSPPTTPEAQVYNENHKTPINYSEPRQDVMQSAGFSDSQVDQLIALDRKNSLNVRIGFMVPTYIPAGFKLYRVDTNDREYSPTVAYAVSYVNKSNKCFVVTGYSGSIGNSPSSYEKIEVTSPEIGKVLLAHTDFDEGRGGSILQTEEFIRGKQTYLFLSNKEANGC